MHGAFGIIYKDKNEQSFFYRINMPDGKFSNLTGYLKFLNLLRVGNCNIDTDDSSTVADFIASLKRIIGNDAEFAANALLHAIFVPVEHVATVLTWLLWLLLFWVLERDSRASQVLNRQFESAEEREIFTEFGQESH